MALVERISAEELDFCESLYDPIALTECSFSDLDNLVLFNEEKFAELRIGQFPMMSYEYQIDEDPKLGVKENFKRKERAGSVYCFGGRKFGKSLCVEIIDVLISMVLLEGEHVGFSSIDSLHIRGIVEKIIQALETHPFYKILNAKINRSPNYRISLPSGYVFESINMNITGKNPGSAFFQKHLHRLYIEEASLETEGVYYKRLDSISENGCVMRVAGMTDFTKYSPAGRIYNDITRKSLLCNLPQYVNPKWDSKEKEKAIKEYGGEQAINYRVFIRGEVVEEGISVFDMERVRKCYNYDKVVKAFEITKDNFSLFKEVLVLERPKNAKVLYVSADIGESAPTEIIIIYEVNGVYYWAYNITVYGLDDKQQYQLFKYIAETLKANFISLDTTDGTGRAIFRALGEVFPKENLNTCSFNEKITVDFEKNDDGRVVFNNGQPVVKEEFVSEWSVRRLKTLLYEDRLSLPADHKFDMQVNSVIATQSGNRTVYACVAKEDHLFSAFRVWAISQWNNEFSNAKSVSAKKFFKSGI